MFNAEVNYKRMGFELSVTLDLKKGSVAALLGASGSGKSTLFRLLSGLEKPNSGKIYSNKICWFDSQKNVALAVEKRNVGLVFQDYALFEHLNVCNNIGYGVKTEHKDSIVKEWLDKTNLSDKALTYPNELSGGEKQRVALARVFAASPEILMLDEPFSALDEFLRHGLRRELQSIISHTQIPVLISTHDLNEARFLADFIYIMADGRIIQSGKMSDVFKKPNSIQSAKVLGWQNLLFIDTKEGSTIYKRWGEILLEKADRGVVCIGIPDCAISLKFYDDSHIMLGLILTRVIDMGLYFLLEVKLSNNERLALRAESDKSMILGEKLNIYINPSLIVTFVE